ncbi:hypothetical protein FANTH_7591 [Fusarium anthophilum]|uniref:Major facilitator superfamily (MFS) profile domain-containing protein n=1 Tax=Fusarium anthophilum TaxID=48485 RepID=A0A8H4ZE07_9HYPO|nr:hypothetical protein FANTH_7591 [Fusarium anthophilum]
MDQNMPSLSLGSNDPESILKVDFGKLSPLIRRSSELGQEYRTSGDLATLEAAIEKSWEAVDSTRDDKPEIRTSCLLYLSYLIRDRYTATNNIEDLDKSIGLAEEANAIANALEEVHPEHPLVLKVLRARLIDRYALTGSESDLDRAVDTARQSVYISSDGASDVSHQYSDLSALLGRRFLATGTVENVDEAISTGWKAIEGEVTDNKSMRLHLLAHIGGLLGHKSLRTGSLADMDEGVRLARQAVEEASEEEPALAESLNSLATLLGQRYSLTGALIDVDEAIALARRSLHTPSYNSTMLATSLGNLAVLLQLRYQRSRKLFDLEESTQLSQQALNTMPDNHPDRSRHQHDIGIKLARKFTITDDMKDLDDGIRSLREAVDNTSKSHPYRAVFLHSLANGLIQKGSETFDGDGVDEWISVAKEALEATPESHPDRGELLYGLGVGLLAAHATGKTPTGIDESIPCFEAAIKQSNAPPLCRIQACMCLLPICHDRQRSLNAAKLVMGLIPRIIPRQQDYSDRQSSLAELAGFASDAVAVAIQAGQVIDAVELFEQGQGLLGASTEQMQTDIVDLEKVHPDYAAEFERLRKEINRPVDSDISATHSTALGEGLALRLYDAGKEFDKLVERIRKLPNFDTFLQTPGLDEMRAITDRGPIIIVNISIICCDAIIIMPDCIQTVPLDDLSRADIEQKVLDGERGSPDVLEWLWETVVCRVLDRIGFSEAPTGDNWPHVWWIPTGLLKQFPLHAAGYHRRRTKETTLDRVVSSYASSVKAMIQARQRRKPTRETNKAVLVAMETTPTLSRLTFANQELEAVKDVCLSVGLEVVEPQRRKVALIEQLHQCKFFHFAGHGCTDPQDPLRSYLCLEDVVTNPLRVGSLLDLNLKDQPPFLAYLSACGTGRIQQEQFMDESVHLISAFQLAGFQHVIGTLWEVNDRVCVEIAKVVYEGIKNGGMLDQSVAWGLHEASRQLRDQWLEKMDQEGPSRGANGGKEDEFGVEERLKACRHLWGQDGGELRPKHPDAYGQASYIIQLFTVESTSAMRLPIVIFVALGSLSYGYASSIIATTLGQPTFFSYFALDSRHNANDLMGAINGLFQAGGFLGTLSCYAIADSLGRREAILAAALISTIGGALQAGSVNIAMFIASRFITGALVTLVPLYQSEMSPSHIRGLLVGIHGGMIGTGYALASYVVLGFYFVKASGAQWRIPLAIQRLPPLLLAVGILFLRETPRWLILVNRIDEARGSFNYTQLGSRGGPTSDEETTDADFETLRRQTICETEQNITFLDLLKTPSMRKRCITGFLTTFGCQATATIVINNYGPLLYASLGFNTVQQLLIQCGWITVAPFGNFINAFLVDHVGRVKMLLGGFAGCIVALIGECITMSVFEKTNHRGAASGAVFFLFLHATIFTLCCDATSYVYASEIFPTPVRAKGLSISVSGLFFATIIFTKAASTAFAAIGWKFYLVFIGTTSIIIAYAYATFPETSKMSLEDIQELFGDPIEGMPTEVANQETVHHLGKDDEKKSINVGELST